jgi:hypothetical protein
MDYFVAGSFFFERYRFTDAAFKSCQIYVDSHRQTSFLRRLCSTLAIANPARFENSSLSFLFPFELLTFVLRKE